MCLGMNPDQLAPGERVRVHLQPQLRGPAGQGRPHPPGLAAGRRGHRRPRHPELALRPDPSTCKEPSRMEKFSSHTGTALPLRRSNVDTDQIIPAVYLKRVTRTGFEDGLFAAWRNDPDFVLNQPGVRRRDDPGRRARTSAPDPRASTPSGRCRTTASRSSSASRFGDIFRGNSGKAGLLIAAVDQKIIEELWDFVEANPGQPIDRRPREEQTITSRGERRLRDRRLHPLAAAGGSGRHRSDPAARGRITAYEADRPSFLPRTLPVRTAG